jgi:hypothetical protein
VMEQTCRPDVLPCQHWVQCDPHASLDSPVCTYMG